MPGEITLALKAVEDLNALRAYEPTAVHDAMERHHRTLHPPAARKAVAPFG